MCDGIVHCIEGEDEDFNLCQDSFPIEATILCQIYKNVTIKAIPCDGKKECRNGEDENCKIPELIFWLMLTFTFVITFIIYTMMKCSLKKNNLNEEMDIFDTEDSTDLDEKWKHLNCKQLKGDNLAKMKVLILTHVLRAKAYQSHFIFFQNETSQRMCAKLLRSSDGRLTKVGNSFKR